MLIVAKTKNVAIGELFEPIRGKSAFNRAYADRNPGPYPVFSASLSGPLCHIDSYDFDGAYLTWTANGYGGRVQLISGKFSVNGDRGVLVPKAPVGGLSYLKHVLEPVLIPLAVGRTVDGRKNEYTKVGPEVVRSAVITLPVDARNEIDFTAMELLSTKVGLIEELQNSVRKLHEQIADVEVVIRPEGKSVELSLGDKSHFSLSIGERLLKKDNKTEGVAAYSANVRTPFGYVARSNLADFERDSLLWGIDWKFQWNRIPAGQPFATTDHCGRLVIHSDLIDPEYAAYYLQATRLEYAFDRVYRANLENIASRVTVEVPVTKTGKFDLAAQRAIAARYRQLMELRSGALLSLGTIARARADLTI